MIDELQILEILETNCKTTPEEISVMLGVQADDVKTAIANLEEKGIVRGYNAIVNWEKTGKEVVEALIEVHITPQRGQGFDKIAKRIYKYPEVKECFLMSGGYDLKLIVEGKTMKDIATFVAQKLSTVENVLSTSTHFVLKKYKEQGAVFDVESNPEREAVVL